MPSASAVEGNVRYNEDNDCLEIYYNGSWVTCIPMGCQLIDLTNNLHAEWELHTGDDYTLNSECSILFSNGITFIGDCTNGWYKGGYDTKLIDLTSINTLKIIYSYSFDTSKYNYNSSYDQLWLYIYSSSGNKLYEYRLDDKTYASKTNIAENIDISSMTGKSYIHIMMYPNSKKSTITFTEFSLLKN